MRAVAMMSSRLGGRVTASDDCARERRRSRRVAWQLSDRVRHTQAGSFNHCVRCTALHGGSSTSTTGTQISSKGSVRRRRGRAQRSGEPPESAMQVDPGGFPRHGDRARRPPPARELIPSVSRLGVRWAPTITTIDVALVEVRGDLERLARASRSRPPARVSEQRWHVTLGDEAMRSRTESCSTSRDVTQSRCHRSWHRPLAHLRFESPGTCRGQARARLLNESSQVIALATFAGSGGPEASELLGVGHHPSGDNLVSSTTTTRGATPSRPRDTRCVARRRHAR